MKALIVIDMQEKYVGENRKESYDYSVKTLINYINNKINLYKNDMVIYIQNEAKEECSDLVSGLQIKSDYIFKKNKASCFSNSELITLLKDNSINELELAGVDGNFCVGLSALEAAKLGFLVSISIQCTGIINKDRFEKMQNRLSKAGENILL